MQALVDVSRTGGHGRAAEAVAGIVSGLDIHYDLGEGHPLLGRRMPDLVLAAAPRFELLHGARPSSSISASRERGGRPSVVDANYEGAWELPVIGMVPAPTAVLIRPDGYVAWVGEGTDAGLGEALRTWFG